MERSFKSLKKFTVLIGVPIISITIVISLLYYCITWYANQKVLVINATNLSQYAVFIVAILLSSFVNIGLTIYYSQSLKRIEKIVAENCLLSDMLIKQGFDNRDEILDAISKVGVEID
jgi:hypothetical protein